MCAIGGILADNHKVIAANLAQFKMIGLFGQRRGEDSVGVLFNNRISKSITSFVAGEKDKGKAINALHGVLFGKVKPDCKAVFVHNRQKSVGANAKENAHPFEYEFEGKRFIFIHNGTIKNYYDLKKKYNIEQEDLIGDTDSEILGYILVHHGFDVLTEYEGAAAFALYNITDNEAYFWKGKSEHDCTYISEERPFHLFDGKGFVAFASEAETLVSAFNVPNETIMTLTPNNLYHYIGSQCETMTLYDRSAIKYRYLTGGTAHYQSNNSHTDYFQAPKGGANIPVGKKHSTTKSTVIKKGNYIEEISPQNIAQGKVYYHKGKYWENGHPISGIIHVDEFGTMMYKGGARLKDTSMDMDAYTCMYLAKGYWVKESYYKEWVSLEDTVVANEMLKLDKVINNIHFRMLLIVPESVGGVVESYSLLLNGGEPTMPYKPFLGYYYYMAFDGSIVTTNAAKVMTNVTAYEDSNLLLSTDADLELYQQ